MGKETYKEDRIGTLPQKLLNRRQKVAERLQAEKEAMRQPTWLRELKRTMLTPERFLAAVRDKGEMLKHIPEALRTEELCLAAVQQDGRMLEYVPETLKSEALCLSAVRQNNEAIQYVPQVFRESMEKALKNNGTIPVDK